MSNTGNSIHAYLVLPVPYRVCMSARRVFTGIVVYYTLRILRVLVARLASVHRRAVAEGRRYNPGAGMDIAYYAIA